ncbi:MAG: protease modulator HflC [Candidatus Omnitrophica bacterium]|nr:protease modulator HflC [Candidatus Omnitrophota bacterium]
MKQGLLALLIIFFAATGILVLNSAYIVDQAQQAVVTQFGEPLGGPVIEPGLHWKTPFMQLVTTFEKRILEWDGYPSEVPTRDKKFIWVDVTGRWRIQDPLKFFQTMHNERNAQSRLDDVMDGITRNFVTQYNLTELVRNTNRIREVEKDAEDISNDTEYDKIIVGRNEITRKILEEAQGVVKEYGIELIDLRIKRINYIPSVQLKVFDRMISERKRAAEELRSEGQGIRAEIEGKREKELKRITSEAYHKAQKLKGQADADATRIYGEVYSKDPDFYAFMSTLEKYPSALQGARLVLSTQNDFLKYLKDVDKKS